MSIDPKIAIELSKDTILKLMKFPVTKSPITISFILQVHTIDTKEKLTKNDSFFTSTLGDSTHKYCGFILKKQATELKPGDLIKISSFFVWPIRKGQEKVFFIKEYEIVKRNCELVKGLSIAIGDTKEIASTFQDNKSNIGKDKEVLNNLHNLTSNNKNNTNDIMMDLSKEENNGVKEVISREKENNDKNIVYKEDNIQIPDVSILKHCLLSNITTFSKDIKLYVKVAKKCEIKGFFNKVRNANSRLLSFDLIDPTGYEMQAMTFDQGCDKFFNIIQEDQIYYIEGGYAKLNDKKYTNIKSDYKIIVDVNTKIIKIPPENDTLFLKATPKKGSDNIAKIKNFPHHEPNSIVDCLVYVIESFPKRLKPTKSGEISFQRLIVGDDSGVKCEFTLWKKFAELNLQPGMFLLLKYVRLNEYNGIRLSTVDDTTIKINPTTGEVQNIEEFQNFIKNQKEENWIMLQKDFDTNNASNITDVQSTSIGEEVNSDILKIVYLKELLNSLNDTLKESPLSTIKCTILEVVHSTKNYYGGCPNKKCKKKLIENAYKSEGDSKDWYCPMCKVKYQEPHYYYTVSLRVQDASYEYYIDFFGETVTKMFDIKAEEYKNCIENNDKEKLNLITEKLEFHEFFFIGKANFHVYNNKSKKKFFAYRYEQIRQVNESRRLLNSIKSKLIQS